MTDQTNQNSPHRPQREYLIEASEAGYRVYVVTDGRRYPMGDQPYNSLIRARDQIPKRYQGKARLIHRTAYTEMINTPDGVSPTLDIALASDSRTL